MKSYKSHKIVEAAKITDVVLGATGTTLYFEGGYYVDVSDAWDKKHEPQIGGYYVKYPDGYESYSPAEAFETGYTLTDDSALPDPTADRVVYDVLSRFHSGDLATRIEDDFSYHETTPEKLAAFAVIRQQCLKLAVHVNNVVPNSREKSLALTKLEEVMFWSNASIARHGGE